MTDKFNEIRSRRPTYTPFPRSKIHSNRILIPNKKAPQNAKYSALRGYFTAGNGGRTRTRSACIRTYSGNVPKYVPNQQKKERSISPAHMKNVCMQ